MSLTPKFTKGPWKVYDRGRNPHDVSNPNLARFWIGAGETDFRGPGEIVPISGEPHLDVEANAYLIAAAPEMYDILAALIMFGPLKHLGIVKSDIEKILAKARGER